jgi:acyl carrier protein
MLARLGEIARQRGLARVDVPFTPSPRNSPALNLLESLGAPAADLLYRLSSEHLAMLEYRPEGCQPAAPPPLASLTHPARQPADFQRIATELAGVGQILERMAARKRPETAPATPSAAPRTELERQLAAIWAELLTLPSVGIHDSFFDLGGHSLLAVQLLSRVRQTFQVDLSLEVVYGGPFTVAELAKAIDLAEIDQAGADYAAVLKEIEALSDAEVQTLLAEHGGRPSGRAGLEPG